MVAETSQIFEKLLVRQARNKQNKKGLSSVDPSGAIMAKAQAGDESFKEVGLNDQLSANQKPHNKLRRGRRTLLHQLRSNIADGYAHAKPRFKAFRLYNIDTC